MDYIGSKTKLNDWIFGELARHIPEDKWGGMRFIDGCAGSCATSKHALRKGFKVISNDLFCFSSVIINGFSNFDDVRMSDGIKPMRKADIEIEKHIDYINSIVGVEGFFFNNYSESAGRSFFTDDNAMRVDATRRYVETISDEKIKQYVLYISLEGLSSVMNTTGVQAAFLKKIKPRALKSFSIKLQPSHKGSVKVYNKDLVEIVSMSSDVLYIDPPYNNRQYGPNYHLYETFVKYDNPKLITDIAGLRNWHTESKSDFCSKKTCANTFRKIVAKSSAKIIMISYSSDGLLLEEELMDIFTMVGEVKLVKKSQNRYRADVSNTDDRKIKRQYDNSELNEFLFIVEKK